MIMRRDRQRTVRAFTAGAGAGVVLGVLLTLALLRQPGGLLGSPRVDPVRVGPRAEAGDDVSGAVIEADERTGEREGAPTKAPAGPPAAVIGPEPSSPHELAERDLAMPVEGVDPVDLTRQFTDLRGGARAHEAIDILAPRHTPVRAVEDGTIARLFLSKAGGITIYQFDRTERFCYYYAHLERYADGLREGDAVRKGQTIGYVGSSGNAPEDTPHLHFAIFRLTSQKRWWEGTPIDPYEVLRQPLAR